MYVYICICLYVYAQAINDKNAIVSSSALVSGLAFFNTSPDVVKRWNNEVYTSIYYY
jgi:coatomer subunit gamma